jgi:cytidylate kinase
MDVVLMKYMADQIIKTIHHKKEPGPVITISREYGSYANEIANILAEELNKKHHAHKPENSWKCVNKEILLKTAEELKTNPEAISHVFDAEEKNFLEDIILSFSGQLYIHDIKIKKTITQVIRKYAVDGKSIIIGQAGCVLCRDISKSLHIKLVAPLDWRIKRIAERYKLSLSAAKEQTISMDQKRQNFIKYYSGDKPDFEIFDAIFNRKTLTSNEIVSTILKLAEVKKIF